MGGEGSQGDFEKKKGARTAVRLEVMKSFRLESYPSLFSGYCPVECAICRQATDVKCGTGVDLNGGC
jgi:hypothetical protein